MSDFDKEAERERLREKYEREEQKREVTERMSELLLKGATMTNAHCQDCGDPIFRYDGQEFCATCEKTVSRPDTDAAEEDQDSETETEELEVATPEDTRVQFGGDGEAAGHENADMEASPAGGVSDGEDTAEDAAPSARNTEPSTVGSAAGESRGAVGESALENDLSPATASLTRSVNDLARRAEGAEDLGRTRELLSATREAAEALSAVRQATR
ncbi:MAG: Sjogren's syndrome/scleroderma autoantigen 1 family protein [Salinirussus sp.]